MKNELCICYSFVCVTLLCACVCFCELVYIMYKFMSLYELFCVLRVFVCCVCVFVCVYVCLCVCLCVCVCVCVCVCADCSSIHHPEEEVFVWLAGCLERLQAGLGWLG